MIVLQLLVGLAVLAGLSWGLVVLWAYLQESPSPSDYAEVKARLDQLRSSHDIARVESETRERMYEAALDAARREQS